MFSIPKLCAPLRRVLGRSQEITHTHKIIGLTFSSFEEETFLETQVREQAERNAEVSPLTELVRDFLHPAAFHKELRSIGIDFFCGVPDSLLKDFCAYVSKHETGSNHVITANEGNAVGLAAGYHLATRKYALVYLQNSGLGNIINPLISLASQEVYSIPMLLLIGWRGEPGKRDEPQHTQQGQVTPGLLNAMGIPFTALPDFIEGVTKTLQTAKKHMDEHCSPYALLVKRQTFLPYNLPKTEPLFPLTREMAVQTTVDLLSDRDIVVSTTGMLSRELYEYRVVREQGHERDFLTVGSMGHASTIALGIALNKPSRQVICFDGDGAVIMHMGALSVIGQSQPRNFKHIVINNGSHDSVGGQATAARNHELFSLSQVAEGNGYKQARVAVTVEELRSGVQWLQQTEGPVMLEVKVRQGSRKGLGRPKRSPIQNKVDFINFISYD